MREMMDRCIEWMMSLGMVGMLVVVVLLIGLIVLVVVLMGRAWRGSGR